MRCEQIGCRPIQGDFRPGSLKWPRLELLSTGKVVLSWKHGLSRTGPCSKAKRPGVGRNQNATSNACYGAGDLLRSQSNHRPDTTNPGSASPKPARERLSLRISIEHESRPPHDLYPERVNITWPILTHSMTSMVCRTAYATAQGPPTPSGRQWVIVNNQDRDDAGVG